MLSAADSCAELLNAAAVMCLLLRCCSPVVQLKVDAGLGECRGIPRDCMHDDLGIPQDKCKTWLCLAQPHHTPAGIEEQQCTAL
jgi:hypothetical protein